MFWSLYCSGLLGHICSKLCSELLAGTFTIYGCFTTHINIKLLRKDYPALVAPFELNLFYESLS